LAGQELGAAFASADAFVFPSRTETLGLVLLEAMAAGCPVVAARSGGIPDIVQDGVNGYLFDPNDEQGAITATQKLLANPNERETLRHNARQEAERWGRHCAARAILSAGVGHPHQGVDSSLLTGSPSTHLTDRTCWGAPFIMGLLDLYPASSSRRYHDHYARARFPGTQPCSGRHDS
jgi:hypothetical protein